MTSTDLAVRANTGLAEKIEYATELAKSELLPRQYRDKPANILLVMEFGEYLGLRPVAALRLIHIIDNKPVASAELIAGRVRSAGHRMRVTYDPEKRAAVCSIWRADDAQFEFRAEWTWERAAAVRDKDGQPLTAKMNWRNYYPSMLKWRATTECARDACPEILLGVSYTPDELGAMTTAQRVAPAELRRMGEPAPGAVEMLNEADPDDPWAAEEFHKPEEFHKLAETLHHRWHFDADDVQALIRWLVPAWKGSRGDIRVITTYLADHLESAGGDVEQASSAVWTQFREATGQEEASDA